MADPADVARRTLTSLDWTVRVGATRWFPFHGCFVSSICHVLVQNLGSGFSPGLSNQILNLNPIHW
jgi:hypothetical protein